MEKTVGEARLRRRWEGLEFCFGHAEFEISTGQPGGHAEHSDGRNSLEF